MLLEQFYDVELFFPILIKKLHDPDPQIEDEVPARLAVTMRLFALTPEALEILLSPFPTHSSRSRRDQGTFVLCSLREAS